jgi:hypothetical protein
MLDAGCPFFLLMLLMLLCFVLCCECNDAGDPVEAASIHYAAPGNSMRSTPRKVRETVLALCLLLLLLCCEDSCFDTIRY